MGRNGNDAGWWSRRWFDLLGEIGLVRSDEPARIQTRGSRVQRLEVQPGEINAKVRDRDRGDCVVGIQIRPLDDAQWNAVIDALGSQAIFAAQLLAGDMPPEIEATFASAGVSLLPKSRAEMVHDCSCCTLDDGGGGVTDEQCRPLVTTYLALGEMLNDDPWLLFRLRGRDRQQILRELRELRNRNSAADPQASPTLERSHAVGEPAIYRPESSEQTAAEVEPLTAMADHFWGKSKPLTEFPHFIAPPAINLTLLRRLGPLPLSTDGAAVSDQLRDIYHLVTQAGLNVAYAGDPDEE